MSVNLVSAEPLLRAYADVGGVGPDGEIVVTPKTNEEIATELSTLTVGPIQIVDVENFFFNESLALKNPITAAWEGPLIDILNSNGPFTPGLTELFSHINKVRSTTIATNQIVWAVKAESLIVNLQLAGLITEEQYNAWRQLPGAELQFPDVSESDVAAQYAKIDADEAARLAAEAALALEQTRIDNRAAYDTRFNQLFNTYLGSVFAQEVVTDAEIVTALQQIAGDWTADGTVLG